MKKIYLILAAAVGMTITSCTSNEYVGEMESTAQTVNDGSIRFGFNIQGMTRAGEFVGASAAEKLGGMFVVEGTKGSEETNSPSTTVVFDNYLVGYEYNSAATTESNTNNWEYVGKEAGITSRMTGLPTTGSTWAALHPEGTSAQMQTIKYWDYTQDQYDFIAWSTGTCEAVPVPAVAAEPSDGTIQVSRIATGSSLSTSGFTMRAANVTDLMKCYYTDIVTVPKANYGAPVTLTFRNMAAKVRVALYETVPGYSVKNVYFYTSDENPTAPEDLGSATSSTATAATLFTMGTGNELPQSGTITVYYPRIGSTYRDASPRPVDYNKASVTVIAGDSKSSTQAFGALTDQYIGKERYEAAGNFYLGRTLPTATFAGKATDNFYTAVVPNTNGKPLTLRVDYTLVSIDGSAEEIHVYGAKAVVPATYTNWLPNYAYTYVFKISDNTNGWTSKTAAGAPEGPAGLFPITFDAVVTSFVDANAEQTTVTTVATPSITTYQQGHTTATNEYSKSKKAGKDATNVKDLYVQVMDNSGATPALVSTLSSTNSLLFSVATTGAPISEATVMDALQNRTNTYDAASPAGRNGITLTENTNIANDVVQIVNGVDDQPITVTSGQAAKIDIDQLATGTYAYVYVSTPPTADERIYNVVADATATSTPTLFYEVELAGTETPLTSGTAAANEVFFVKNVDTKGNFVSYTFKQTKVGDDVTGLVKATIDPATKATEHHTTSAGHYYFYFDVYNQNDGAYAVKVIKVVG